MGVEFGSNEPSTVSFATLESRPSIPSFNYLDSNWQPEIGLRLEGTLRGEQFNGDEPKVVVVLGPKGDGGRPMVVYDKQTGAPYRTGIENAESYYIDQVYRQPSERYGIIREGENVRVGALFSENEGPDTGYSDKISLTIESIKSGPLT